MLPAVDSNLVPEAVAEAVLRHYVLPVVTRCRLHTRGLNDTFQVQTATGGVYFLRVYRAGWRSLEQIESELAMLRHLAASGVAVSAPVPRKDASCLTDLDCAEGPRWACLFPAAPGRELAYKSHTPVEARHYGAMAAAVHSAADSYAGPANRPPAELEGLLEQPLRLILATLADRSADVSYLSGLADRLRAGIQQAEPLTRGFCHGDLHGRNANLQDGVFTLYDFDCCGWGYRAYDLAVFPWAFAIGGSEPDHIESMARAFLAGYQATRAVEAADLSVLPLFVAVRQIWLIGLHIALADRFGWSGMGPGYFDGQLHVLRRWEENFLARPSADWLRTG
jgi:Ser/Thr protein kinase RdoA (MazF antagonist)